MAEAFQLPELDESNFILTELFSFSSFQGQVRRDAVLREGDIRGRGSLHVQGDQRLRAPHRGLRAHRGRVRGKGVLHAYHAGTLFSHVVKKC